MLTLSQITTQRSKGLGNAASAVAGATKGAGGFASYTNAFTGLVSAGANLVTAFKGNRGGGGYTHNEKHEHYHEAEKSKEELDIMRQSVQGALENQRMQNALKMQSLADQQRALDRHFDATDKKNDNTIYYVMGGVLALGIILIVIK